MFNAYAYNTGIDPVVNCALVNYYFGLLGFLEYANIFAG